MYTPSKLVPKSTWFLFWIAYRWVFNNCGTLLCACDFFWLHQQRDRNQMFLFSFGFLCWRTWKNKDGELFPYATRWKCFFFLRMSRFLPESEHVVSRSNGNNSWLFPVWHTCQCRLNILTWTDIICASLALQLMWCSRELLPLLYPTNNYASSKMAKLEW